MRTKEPPIQSTGRPPGSNICRASEARPVFLRSSAFRFLVWIASAASLLFAGYRARPYAPLPVESYPSRLTSEGLTVGVEPLYTDALAAKVFDKRDIVKNGIMPLAVIIQNDNGFAVEIDGSSIELLIKGERIRPVSPEEAIMRIFRRTRSPQEVRVPSPIPLPRIPISDSNQDALDDFSHKHLGTKMIEPKSLAAGFVYFPVKGFADLRADLSEAQVYIPDLYRTDTGESMIFIEIDLKPAIDARAPK